MAKASSRLQSGLSRFDGVQGSGGGRSRSTSEDAMVCRLWTGIGRAVSSGRGGGLGSLEGRTAAVATSMPVT